SRQERELYEDSLKYYRDVKNTIDTAREEGFNEGLEKGREEGIKEGIERGIKEGIEKGMKEGIEKGMKEGIEKGIKEGIEKGMKEGIERGREEGRLEERLLFARRLLEKGFSVAQIVELTGLDEIRLQKFLSK
ncbi:MAG: hypothetical protein NZM39_10845, partial [Bernardetiaceae bacterium]|nr:hypothetical protein [Bernardetiaceae bacterium]